MIPAIATAAKAPEPTDTRRLVAIICSTPRDEAAMELQAFFNLRSNYNGRLSERKGEFPRKLSDLPDRQNQLRGAF
jgi:hypothetical protein